MKFDRTIRREIEKHLGSKIPEPTSPGYPPFLASLRVSHPVLAQKLEGAVILESYGDPQSEAERRAVIAERLQSIKQALIDRYDETQGAWFLSRRKLVLWILLPIALIIGNVFLKHSPKDVMAQTSGVVQAVGGQLGFGSSLETSVDMTPPPDLPVTLEETLIQKTPTPSVATASPSPLKQSQVSQAPVPTPPPPTLKPSGIYSREDPAVMSVFTKGDTEMLQVSTDPFAATQTVGQRTLSVYSAESQVRPLSMLDDETDLRQLSVFLEDSDHNLSVYSLPGDFGMDTEVPTMPTASDPFATPVSVPNETSHIATTFTTGTSVMATLEVGIIAMDNETIPVIARGDDGSVWQGQARLNDTNRFTLESSSVFKEGVSQKLEARAVALDGYADLPAMIRETTPAIASDLLRGALGGVSNYVENLSQQTTTIVDDFGKTISRKAPSLENQILGSVSEMFSPTTDQALVRVAELPAGTQFMVMVF